MYSHFILGCTEQSSSAVSNTLPHPRNVFHNLSTHPPPLISAEVHKSVYFWFNLKWTNKVKQIVMDPVYWEIIMLQRERLWYECTLCKLHAFLSFQSTKVLGVITTSAFHLHRSTQSTRRWQCDMSSCHNHFSSVCFTSGQPARRNTLSQRRCGCSAVLPPPPRWVTRLSEPLSN